MVTSSKVKRPLLKDPKTQPRVGTVVIGRREDMKTPVFDEPTPEILEGLVVGDYVKVGADREYFWVELEKVSNKKFVTGKIDNGLFNCGLHHLHEGDIIEFNRDRIYEVLKKAKNEELK